MTKPLSSSLHSYLIWSIAALFYAYENVMQVSQGLLADDIMHRFHVDMTHIGFMASIYFWAYALMQIPVGLMIDAWGIKKPLILAICLCTLGGLFTAYGDAFWHIGVSRLLVGAGSSFAPLSALAIAGRYFQKQQFALLTGLLLSIGLLGQMLGEYPYLQWIEYAGWQSSYLIFVFLGLLLLVSVIVFLPSSPVTQVQTCQYRQLMQVINPSLLRISVFAMCMFTPYLILVQNGLPLIMNKLIVTKAIASKMLIVLPLGFIITAPLLGAYATNKQRILKLLLISSALSLLSYIMILFMSRNLGIMTLFLFFFGSAVSGFLPAFGLAKMTVDITHENLAMGIINTLNMLGAAIYSPLMGYMMDNQGHLLTSSHSMDLALGIMVFFLAFALWLIKGAYDEQTC